MSLSSHVQYVHKSCWLYLQNRSRIQPLLLTLWSKPLSTHLDYYNGLPTSLLLPLPTSGYSHHSHQREPIKWKLEDTLRFSLSKVPPSGASGTQNLYKALHRLPGLTCDSSFPRPLLWDNTSLLPSPKLAGGFLQGDFYNLSFSLPSHLHNSAPQPLQVSTQNMIFSTGQSLATL